MFLIFDTETTGLPKNWKAPLTDTDNWPRMVQLAWQMHDLEGNFIEAKNHVIYPDGYTIPSDVVKVHGISTEIAQQQGIPLKEALDDFMADVAKSNFIVGHNVGFDINIVGCELIRCEMEEALSSHPYICTMNESKEFCDLKKNGRLKNPSLTELHIKLFGVRFEEAHNAAADVEATSRCFLELIRIEALPLSLLQMSQEQLAAFIRNNPDVIQPVGIDFVPFKKDDFKEFSLEDVEKTIYKAAAENDEVYPFVHLHVHSEYSILDGASKLTAIANKAKEDGQPAVAVTDHGSMFAMKEFHNACKKADVKPILGVEAYVARRGHLRKDDKTDSSGYHLILLAKNEVGYVNLLKLTTIAYKEGFYYKPRIDKDLLEQYKDGLIVSSACLGGEVSQHIMNGNIDEARNTISWFKRVFQDDYYLEISRHINHDPILRKDTWENQAKVAQTILELAKEMDVKVIATNDSHFTNEEDAESHDLLVCMNTGRDYDDPTRMRYTKQEWFKTRKEMSELFADIPEVLENTIEIANKVEYFELDHAPFMPPFDIPEEFGTFEEYVKRYTEEDINNEFTKEAVERLGGYEKTVQIKIEADYLTHLAFEGAKKHYGEELGEEVKERLLFELETIKTMGFPGYFLIVQDFINWAKNNGVLVGPGRGSAAGSAVAYCVGITNVDPIEYDLLFERFLNPDRISMPDVDIDFDDDGRQRVLDYVTEKYGHDKVAHICTFGTMATKSSIKDVARVLGLPLKESIRLTKLVPDAPKMTFKKAYAEVPELYEERSSSDPLIRKTLRHAEVLEGAVRQTGVHACGVLIGKNPLNEHLPVMPTKGEELLTTQYDGRFVEDIGLLKMDFLGLKTLSIIKEVLANIKHSKDIEIDIDELPLDDPKTFELFSNGETTAVFQFESPGMKKHLKALKPDKLGDLVAMNALYRPGPMEYIPSFIERKHGKEEIKYDHPLMQALLEDTYGITVYQEQVMLLSRALAGFTRGDSDSLRKAMGKKIIAMMDKLKEKFVAGCLSNKEFMAPIENGETEIKDANKIIEEIWRKWEAFASYAFNKSHSVCYAYIAYQTGYLKAHYPAEFMAGVLSNNLSDISKITTFMEECQSMALEVKGPDVNESYRKFTVNAKGDIRFGMAGVKGVGESAVEEIITEREKNGPYKDIFDFVERVNLKTVNKRSIESLANAGAFDNLGMKRSQFFTPNDNTEAVFLDKLVRFGQQVQSEKASTAMSLFGEAMSGAAIKTPDIPDVPEYPPLIRLEREKELVGIYLSAHPLDDYSFEFERFISKDYSLRDLKERMGELEGQTVTFGGKVLSADVLISKNGNPFGKITLADYRGVSEIMLFGRDYVEYGKFCKPDIFIMVQGEVRVRLAPKKKTDDEKNKDGKKKKEEKKKEETQEEPVKKNYFFSIKNIELLDDVRDKYIKSVTIAVPLDVINEKFILDMNAMILKNQGSKELYFNVWDTSVSPPAKVDLFSTGYLIDFTREFERFLKENARISYKINNFVWNN